eukprot:TRINITY_DN2576_c0_g1_i1.p2 TRINITY_DN2576_c0_g1~~TRINITY_DN2576_c0_g1_i1.p2  ORF type:complete len:87 (+),score=10.86 TRINITY_DN2576_c0_g1_i1:48-308(+)
MGSQDKILGTLQFAVQDIVRNRSLEKVGNLENGARVIFTFYRASIVDENMVDGLRTLISKEDKWTENDLRKVGLTLQQLVGAEPFS